MALLFLDLDRFKIINDSLGHAVGDQLLRVVARRLKSCVREEDTVARLGGDEFMVLLPSITGSSDAGKIGNKIINALVAPVSCQGHELHITTSVGVSLYPYDGSDADTLIKHADISMYRAKELGQNKLIYYTAEMNAESRRQLALETSHRRALERGEMTLVYQPKIDTSRKTIIGAEALLRWEHPTMGTISPADFIPIAEDSGLIVQIDKSFVHEIPDNREDASIAMAIIAMARSLNLNIVAEGVENHRQLNFFRQQGVQVVQGYLFSKPVPAEAFGRMLKQQDAPGAIIQGS